MFRFAFSSTQPWLTRIGTAALASGALLLACAGGAQANRITFDDVPDGTIINTRYHGVQFTAVGTGGSADVYARKDVGAASAPNVVSLVASPAPPCFDRRFGGIQATFQTPQAEVSLDARPVLPPEYLGTPSARPFLQAFDANGNFLGVVYYPIPYGAAGYGSWQTLRIKLPTASIKYVQFSSQYISGKTPVYGLFDNLAYTQAVDVTTKVSLQLYGPYWRWYAPGQLRLEYDLYITNNTATPISGPIQVLQSYYIFGGGNFSNVSGYYQGYPYVSYPSGLPAGGTAVLRVTFDNGWGPSSLSQFVQSLRVYSGTF
jgi:hypothetical protein